MKWITRSNVKVDRLPAPGLFDASLTRRRSSFSYPKTSFLTRLARKGRLLSMRPGFPK